MRYEQQVLALVEPELVAVGDSYHFGIFAGVGLKRFVDKAREADKLPRRLWGFDTFSGFPDTPKDQLGKYKSGGFDVRGKLGVSTPAEAMQAVIRHVCMSDVVLLRGAFGDVLTPGLKDMLGMRPACLVDIDCDLYMGASDALHWLRREALLVSGTIIYYDDWGAFPAHKGGESLAHDEAVADICDLVWQRGGGRHVKVAFRVR